MSAGHELWMLTFGVSLGWLSCKYKIGKGFSVPAIAVCALACWRLGYYYV